MISATLTGQAKPWREADVSPENQRVLLEAGSWCWYVLRAVHIAVGWVLVCACAALEMIAVAVRK